MKIFIYLFCLTFMQNKDIEKHTLSIEIEGINSEKGNVLIALYREKDTFPSRDKLFKYKVQAVGNKIFTFENLPQDTYAFSVFLDENKNGILDKNMIGVPTEKYGFSNNARETFSAPSFKSASFELKKDKKTSVLLK